MGLRRTLELHLDIGRYPDDVTEARVAVRWVEDGAYTVHSVETRGDDVWQCRWDRHPKPGVPVAHCHPPPDAAVEAEPSPLGVRHHLGVLFSVLGWIEGRTEQLREA